MAVLTSLDGDHFDEWGKLPTAGMQEDQQLSTDLLGRRAKHVRLEMRFQPMPAVTFDPSQCTRETKASLVFKGRTAVTVNTRAARAAPWHVVRCGARVSTDSRSWSFEVMHTKSGSMRFGVSR